MNNYNEIKESFGKQADKFASYHMSKKEYTDYLIHRVQLEENEKALEVAAGTCICVRALAPYLKNITWLDLSDTPEQIQDTIKKLMKDDLDGKEKAGFNPYVKDGEIMFDHRWLLMIGMKK